MNGTEMMTAAMNARRAAGLGLIVHGIEGRPSGQPFTCYAKDASQKSAWVAKWEAAGCTVEAMV